MKVVSLMFAILFTIVSILLIVFISSMVSLVGVGDDFWSVGLVQFAIFSCIVSLASWIIFIKKWDGPDVRKKRRV